MAEARIQKVLADAGIASRRRAEDLVAAGRVHVNGATARIGQRVDPTVDRVTVDGKPIPAPGEHVYLALNKPAGVTSTVSDRHASRTVLDLVPGALKREARLYPVGRLDFDSEGLVLLTNDGEWADRVLHPRYEVEREYAVALRAPLPEEARFALANGISLDEGVGRMSTVRRATDAEVRKLAGLIDDVERGLHWYRVILAQGWKRQVRRMFTAVGAPVERLVRVRVGTMRLEDLRPGESRLLSKREASSLTATAAGSRGLVVSLDGPASSGKSTVGAGAAARLGYRFCDTGMLYRALTWLALERGVDVEDAEGLAALAPEVEMRADRRGRVTRVTVDGRDVTDQVRTTEVDRNVSQVSRHAHVREALLPTQRAIAADGGIIMAGRDIGTVVLPDADLKLYLHVPLEERARRRAEDRGITMDARAEQQLEAELRRRDQIDSTRTAAPLRVPEGATIIESEGNTLDETIDEVVQQVQARAAAERR